MLTQLIKTTLSFSVVCFSCTSTVFIVSFKFLEVGNAFCHIIVSVKMTSFENALQVLLYPSNLCASLAYSFVWYLFVYVYVLDCFETTSHYIALAGLELIVFIDTCDLPM